jgi:hypothetical protein
MQKYTYVYMQKYIFFLAYLISSLSLSGEPIQDKIGWQQARCRAGGVNTRPQQDRLVTPVLQHPNFRLAPMLVGLSWVSNTRLVC